MLFSITGYVLSMLRLGPLGVGIRGIIITAVIASLLYIICGAYMPILLTLKALYNTAFQVV